MTRAEFRAAYRAARLLPHRFAAQAAFKTIPVEHIAPALQSWCNRHDSLGGGLAYAKCAARNGYSFRHAVRLYLAAAARRRAARRHAA